MNLLNLTNSHQQLKEAAPAAFFYGDLFYFDTHSHLYQLSSAVNSSQFHSTESGLKCFCTFSTRVPQVYPVISDLPYVLGFGLHPWFLDSTANQQCALIESYLACDSKLVVGEVGLDFSAKYQSTKSLQVEILHHFFQINSNFNRPVSLHIVHAQEALMPLIKTFPQENMIIHGFFGTYEQAKQLVDRQIYLGIGWRILTSSKLQMAIRTIPIDYLLLESDYPTPDEFHYIDVVSKIAAIKQLPLEEVMLKLYENAQRIFNPYIRCE